MPPQDKDTFGSGVQAPRSPAEPHGRADSRHPQDGGTERLLPGYFGAVGGGHGGDAGL